MGVKLAKGIGFLDISQKTGTWEQRVELRGRDRFKGPACIAKNGGLRSSSLHERNRKLLRFRAASAPVQRGISVRIWPSCFVMRDVRMDELCCSSRDFLLLFFFIFILSFFLSLSLSLFLPVVYWNGFIGNIVDSAEIYCAEESCVGGGVEVCRGEWMRGWWVCLEF